MDKGTKKLLYNNIEEIPAERFKEIVLESNLIDSGDMVNDMKLLGLGLTFMIASKSDTEPFNHEEKHITFACHNLISLLGLFYDEINKEEEIK